ncbi:MAG: PCMD domain-containing protein [Bacteroidales bacterium]
MKKIVVIMMFFLFYTAMYAQIQLLPNGNFENWSLSSGLTSSIQDGMLNPVGWETSSFNYTIMTISMASANTVLKDSTSPYSGRYCAKLENMEPSTTMPNNIDPGVMTLGKFTLTISGTTPSTSLSGGIPFTSTPSDLKGYYQYSPQSGDSCQIAIVLTKTNTSTHKPDTVAYSLFQSNATISSWTLFDLPLTYKIMEAPDSMNVTIMSSTGKQTTKGSIMYVDNVYVEGNIMTTGIENKDNGGNVNLYPNPASKIVNIQLNNELTGDANLKIYNSLGELVGSEMVNSANSLYTIDIAGLQKGFYYVSISNKACHIIKKLLIE